MEELSTFILLCFPSQEKFPPQQLPGRLTLGDATGSVSVSIQKASRNYFASYQIQISQPLGKTILQWVSSSDLVEDLKMDLERRIGIPSGLQRLLFQGKQLEDLLPLSTYNINRNDSLVLTLRLRGGAAR